MQKPAGPASARPSTWVSPVWMFSAGMLWSAVACALMSSRELICAFWAEMQANDWRAAATYLAPDCVIDWPCTGERIVGRSDFAAMQAVYPTNTGRWSFDVHRLIAEENTVVSEVTVSDGEQSARVVALSEIEGGHVRRQTEYWPIAYDPLPGRENLTRPIQRIP